MIGITTRMTYWVSRCSLLITYCRRHSWVDSTSFWIPIALNNKKIRYTSSSSILLSIRLFWSCPRSTNQQNRKICKFTLGIKFTQKGSRLFLLLFDLWQPSRKIFVDYKQSASNPYFHPPHTLYFFRLHFTIRNYLSLKIFLVLKADGSHGNRFTCSGNLIEGV